MCFVFLGAMFSNSWRGKKLPGPEKMCIHHNFIIRGLFYCSIIMDFWRLTYVKNVLRCGTILSVTGQAKDVRGVCEGEGEEERFL